MSIYSKDRYFDNRMTETNNAYYDAAIDQIMPKVVINEHSLFTSMYYSDMSEVASLFEGVGDVFQTIKNAIVSFYKKILAFIDAAIKNISDMLSKIFKRTKKYDLIVKAEPNNSIDKIELKDFRNRKKTTVDFDSIQKYLKDANMNLSSDDTDSIIKGAIKGATIDGEITVGKIKDAFFESPCDTTVGKAVFTADGKTGFNALVAATDPFRSATIKDMENKRKEIERLFKEHLKKLDREAKKAKGSSEEGKKITEMRKTTTAVQGAVSKLTSGLISVAKYETARNKNIIDHLNAVVNGEKSDS